MSLNVQHAQKILTIIHCLWFVRRKRRRRKKKNWKTEWKEHVTLTCAFGWCAFFMLFSMWHSVLHLQSRLNGILCTKSFPLCKCNAQCAIYIYIHVLLEERMKNSQPSQTWVFIRCWLYVKCIEWRFNHFWRTLLHSLKSGRIPFWNNWFETRFHSASTNSSAHTLVTFSSHRFLDLIYNLVYLFLWPFVWKPSFRIHRSVKWKCRSIGEFEEYFLSIILLINCQTNSVLLYVTKKVVKQFRYSKRNGKIGWMCQK